MRAEDAAARVRRRLNRWVDEHGRGAKTTLAKKVLGLYGKPRTTSWVIDLLDGPDDGGQDLRLRDLDAVAAAMGIQPGELVAHEGHEYAEITTSELKLLRYYRSLPATVQHNMIAYLDFLFAAHQREQTNIEQERIERTERAKRKGIA